MMNLDFTTRTKYTLLIPKRLTYLPTDRKITKSRKSESQDLLLMR